MTDTNDSSVFCEFPVHHCTTDGILVQLPHNAGFGRITRETLGGDALAHALFKHFATRSVVPGIPTRRRDRQGYRMISVHIAEVWSELLTYPAPVRRLVPHLVRKHLLKGLGTTTSAQVVRCSEKGTVFKVHPNNMVALAVLEQSPGSSAGQREDLEPRDDSAEVEVRLLNYDVESGVLNVTAQREVVEGTPLDTQVAAQALRTFYPGRKVLATVLLSSTEDRCAVVEVRTTFAAQERCSLLGYYIYDWEGASTAARVPVVGAELWLTVELVAESRSLQDAVPFLILSQRSDFGLPPAVRQLPPPCAVGLVGPLLWRDPHSDTAVFARLEEAGAPATAHSGRHTSGETDSDAEEADGEDGEGGARVRRRKVEEAVDAYERHMMEAAPSSPEEFQRLILATPNSSYLWTQFMAYHVKLHQLEEARLVAEKALQTISPVEEEHQLNVWVAYMNLENLYGTGESLNAIFKRALPRQSDPLILHERLADIFEASRKPQQLLGLCRTLTTKWSDVPRTWERLGRVLIDQNKRDQLKRMIKDMRDHLKKDPAAMVVVHLAVREFRHGSVESGRALLEGLLTTVPKKSDVWLAFADQEVALLARQAPQGSAHHVRNLFDRAVAMNFTAKVTQLLFTKYMNFEKEHGTPAEVERVKQMARNYVEAKIQAVAQPSAAVVA